MDTLDFVISDAGMSVLLSLHKLGMLHGKGTSRTSFVFDTGSKYTIINRPTFVKLGYFNCSVQEKLYLRGITGGERASIYKVPSFKYLVSSKELPSMDAFSGQ